MGKTRYALLFLVMTAGCGSRTGAGEQPSTSSDPRAGAGDVAPGTGQVAPGAFDPCAAGPAYAKACFTDEVYPVIAKATSCGGCHGAQAEPPERFLANNAEDSYRLLEGTIGLIARPEVSPLTQHVHADASITNGPEEIGLLTRWLTLEVVARSLVAH